MFTLVIVAVVAFAAGIGATALLKPKYPSTVAELEVLVAGASAKIIDLKNKYTSSDKVAPATAAAIAAETAKVQS